MAARIDIRKVETPACFYYESVEDVIPYTFIGRLKGITEEGHQILLQRKPFCRLLRTLVKAFQEGRTPDKSELCKSFHLPGRVYNTAKMAAEAMIKSAIESQNATLEDLEFDINRQVVEAFWGNASELPGRVKKLLRLYRRRKRLLAQEGRPHIHFGKKFYQDQEAKGWKKGYEEARSDRIGCLGSADEAGGNSTFQLKPVYQEDKLRFELSHSQKLMGHFTLKPAQRERLEGILAINRQAFRFSKEIAKFGPRKGQMVDRKVTTGRVPLTIWLIHKKNGHWYIHISFFRDKNQPDYQPIGAIGVDMNCDSIAETRVRMADGEPLILEEHKRMFDPSWSRDQKETWIYEQITEIVLTAKANRCVIILEYLDFEGCKRWLRTKLGAMLRIMPYRKIRKAFERRCMEHGVVPRYVKSNFTSILGAVLTSYPNLGRDQAAAAVIGLRGMEEGNAWLENRCQALVMEENARLRINRKSNFGCTVTTEGVLIARQLEESPQGAALPMDRETDTHWFQNCAGRAISALSKAMGAHLYQEESLPTRWKRSGLKADPWHPVVPPDVKRRSEKPTCSTLSNPV